MDMDQLDDVVRSNIGRIVAFVLTPLLLPLVAVGTAWLQRVIGVGLDPAEVVGVVVATTTGVAAVAYKWLHNRGEFERLVLEVHKLYDAGKELAPGDPVGEDPVVPPGLK
jgi:hypothetical protein